jgi:2,4-dienoyl-CoA reductase-like NADH-dependent reductase (Old Yellow Enzyme family)
MLFEPLALREVILPNRIGVSPMCQYSAQDGIAGEWHRVHLGSRAVGGAGLVIAEASAVSPEGRISPADLGIWSDAHADALAPIADFIGRQGAVPGIQLAHAGRKASTDVPWLGRSALTPAQGGWQVLGPSAVAFGSESPVPRAMDAGDIAKVVDDFGRAAMRATRAGFCYVELHFAHGYLVHSFLSPLSNFREDRYGGSREGRSQLALEIVRAVRAAMPSGLALGVRLSSVDWLEGGWTIGDSVALSRWLKREGVDLVDCSSGSVAPGADPPAAVPGFQVPFARQIRAESGIATAAVGLITEPQQAETILAEGSADLVLLARAMLLDPYWPLHAAEVLGAELAWPPQYRRAVRRRPKKKT